MEGPFSPTHKPFSSVCPTILVICSNCFVWNSSESPISQGLWVFSSHASHHSINDMMAMFGLPASRMDLQTDCSERAR
jgi:hypothetical protein